MNELPEQPVTITVRRSVKPDRVKRYEASLQQLLSEAQYFDGYLGAEIQRPSAGDSSKIYQSVFRFKDASSLYTFEQSDTRSEFLASIKDDVASDGDWVVHTGLEVWFEAHSSDVPQPSKARMAFILVWVVWSLVLSIGALAGLLIGDLWYPLRLLIVITVEVAIMTYILMPWLTRRLYKFLYPTTRGGHG